MSILREARRISLSRGIEGYGDGVKTLKMPFGKYIGSKEDSGTMWGDAYFCTALDQMMVGEDVAIAGDNKTRPGTLHRSEDWAAQPIPGLPGTVQPR